MKYCYSICIAYCLNRNYWGLRFKHFIKTLNHKYYERFIKFSTIFKFFWCNDVRLIFTLSHIDNTLLICRLCSKSVEVNEFTSIQIGSMCYNEWLICWLVGCSGHTLRCVRIVNSLYYTRRFVFNVVLPNHLLHS